MSHWFKLIISLALPQIAGGLGAYFTIPAVQGWYTTLHKPSFNPPNWIFGPMWTFLYVLMGIACYLIWKSEHPAKKKLLTLYFFQLALNAIWSPAFFGAESPMMGLFIILPLWLLILICVIQFKKISTWASGLMIPYLAWVTFASLLNFSIWWLN